MCAVVVPYLNFPDLPDPLFAGRLIALASHRRAIVTLTRVAAVLAVNWLRGPFVWYAYIGALITFRVLVGQLSRVRQKKLCRCYLEPAAGVLPADASRDA
jgi:hypothetical protein